MRFVRSVVLVFLVIGSSFNVSAADVNSQSQMVSSSKVDVLETKLRDDGFSVKEWKYGAIDVAKLVCSEVMRSGYGNNAGAKYFSYTSEVAPGVFVVKELQLEPYDAVVLIAKTPPPVAYFSYRSYLFKHFDEKDQRRHTVFTSLGDTINNLTISTGRAQDGTPFDKNVMIISTADRGIDARIRAAAEKAGFASRIINTDVIPSAVAKLGKGSEYDSFVFLNRLYLPAYGHEEDFQTYVDDPGAVALYVTLDTPPASLDPFPTPDLRVRGTGQSETDLMPALQELRKAILNKHSGYKATELTTKIWLNEWLDGIEREKNLLGETRDTSYLRTEDFTLIDDSSSFLIVYGVNHEATGKATYSNFAVYNADKELGICGENSRGLAGSAFDYIPLSDKAQYLYAWKVARNCGNDPKCITIELPADVGSCPAIDLGSDLFVAFRAYIEPATAVGPYWFEILYDQAIKFEQDPAR